MCNKRIVGKRRTFAFRLFAFCKMSDDELRQVELIVNDKIRENIKVEVRYLQKKKQWPMAPWPCLARNMVTQ